MNRFPLLLTLISAPAFAEEIVVTGRGLPASAGDRAYDVTVIDRDRLTTSASGRLDDILRDVPGVQNFRRSDARSANPTSQGVTLRGLGGNASSRALLILDGVPQTDPFGGWINWPAYDPERLGAVRVIRGGGSGLYGPGALAGTIELTSAGPGDIGGAHGSLYYGSRDSLDARAGWSGGLGAGFAAISANYGRGDGFTPIVADQRGPVDRPSPYEQASVGVRGAAPLSADVEVQVSGTVFTDRRERGTPLSANSTTGADASLRLVGPDRWSALFYVQTRDFYNSFASVNAARTQAVRVAEQVSVPSTGLGARVEWIPRVAPDFTLRVGGDWRQTSGETREGFFFVNDVATRGRVAGGTTDVLGLFADGAWETEAMTISLGGRIDHWAIHDGRLTEKVFATGRTLTGIAFDDRSGWRPTGRIGAAYRPGPALTLRGAAYLGWRLPTLNELYRPFRVGAETTRANAGLAPERLRGIEAGIDYRPLSTARLGLTLFANRLDDPIANVTIGPNLRERQNLGGIEAKGAEFDASLGIGAWTLSGGYSYVDAKVIAGGPAAGLNGLRPAQTPRHFASTTLGWRGLAGAHASVTARYTGDQYEDDLGERTLPDALTFDAAAGVRLTPSLALALRAENLTDTRVVATLSSDGLVERAAPRTLWVGLRFGAQ
ncbi:TonB-dependent receptor [Allosphingosinicella flava]|uniref:TonB-dependent receptor n=1 Tax=Allosphingosinicella flava TaxID=2771430 RepID=A0A7T2GJC7_9SPHN|nr:TonB-dependent receptor [Sphingosinicella flava]QPQ54929.1 TonB-dependent receptor [Sphingosinicella flava]